MCALPEKVQRHQVENWVSGSKWQRNPAEHWGRQSRFGPGILLWEWLKVCKNQESGERLVFGSLVKWPQRGTTVESQD